MTTHLAGSPIVLNGIAIQRCIVCGEAIIKDDLRRQAFVSSDPNDKGDPHFFKIGMLVEIEEGNPKRISATIELPQDFNMQDLPESFCLALVEV